MSEEMVSVLQAVEVAKKGAKKARTRDIYDTIKPIVSSHGDGMRITDLYTDEQSLKPDDPFEIHKRPPLIIREDLSFRQSLKYPKKPTEHDLLVIEYLEKLVGRIIYYYKTNYDLENGIASDCVVQCNFVPFSPMRKYVIPSGIPVVIPRWIILFLKEVCVNNIVQFEKKSADVLEQEKAIAQHLGHYLIEDSNLVIRTGPSRCRIMELPFEPTSFIG